MRQNALLRSGKGLATPGTARKNVSHVSVVKPASIEGREGHFAVRNGVHCAGGTRSQRTRARIGGLFFVLCCPPAVVSFSTMAEKRWIPETLFDDLGFRMTYEVKRVIYELHTEHQHLVLFENPFFGKMLMLDGATQVTTADEFIY